MQLCLGRVTLPRAWNQESATFKHAPLYREHAPLPTACTFSRACNLVKRVKPCQERATLLKHATLSRACNFANSVQLAKERTTLTGACNLLRSVHLAKERATLTR